MEITIPFDGIITLLIFLIGIPALVLQFMAADVRRVIMKKITIPKEVATGGMVAFTIVVISIGFAEFSSIRQDVVWSVMFLVLFMIVGYTTVQVQYKYGWREVVISSLKESATKKLHQTGGQLDTDDLLNLIEIGKQSEAGPDREVVLKALQDLTNETCVHEDYHGDALVSLIDGLVKMLSIRPVAEDIQNYQIAVDILTMVLSSGSADQDSSLIDQQHAVRALSALGQTFLSQIKLSISTDHILIDYEEALGLAVSHQPAMLTDVTQSLLEVGAVALEYGHYLFAVASFERLLSIIEEDSLKPDETLADLLGLAAHFWVSGASSRDFVQRRLSRIEDCLRETFPKSLEKARLHSQMTMRFDTADKLTQMGEELRHEE